MKLIIKPEHESLSVFLQLSAHQTTSMLLFPSSMLHYCYCCCYHYYHHQYYRCFLFFFININLFAKSININSFWLICDATPSFAVDCDYHYCYCYWVVITLHLLSTTFHSAINTNQIQFWNEIFQPSLIFYLMICQC